MRRIQSIKKYLADLLIYTGRQPRPAMYFDKFIEVLVLLNVVAVILESFEELDANYQTEFDLFEIFTVAVFSAEFLVRLWVSDIRYPAKYRWHAYRKFLVSPMALIDLIAIVPFFIPFIINVDLRHLRILRLLRLLRVFRLNKYSHSLRLITRIITEKKEELTATLLLTFSVLVVASTLMYYIEKDAQPHAFPNIMYAFWWAIVTLTTIGYGDVYPITGLGKVLGGLVAITGVLMVAIPTGIISSSFVQKMEETAYKKRIQNARRRLRDAFYKKYVPELACKVRRGQLSVDAVKVNLELSEEDLYKIAEGNNEFRFRFKKVVSYGRISDKLFLEYREINTRYGTYTHRNSKLALLSPESLNKQSIGYFVYCLAEKMKCHYISNEFFGDEAEVTEESFGDKGLELANAFNFRHNKAYMQKIEEEVPAAFIDWQEDIRKVKSANSLYLIFNTFEEEIDGANFIHLTYFKRNNLQTETPEYSLKNTENVVEFSNSLSQKGSLKWKKELRVTENTAFQSVKDNNLLLYIHEKVESDVLLVCIHREFLLNQNLFSLVSILSEAIKEDLVGWNG